MRKIALIAALIVVFASFGSVPADAGAEVNPSVFKLLKGSVDSGDPIGELSDDDDDYLIVLSEGSGGDDVASIQLTFTDIPDVVDPTQLRIQHAAKGSPTCSARMWHWRKEKFIAVGDAFAVGSESEESITLENPGRFVRRDKARTRISCKDDVPYGVGFDLVHFIP